MMMNQIDITRYELPATGITLLGYIVRRMHKTLWLIPVPMLAATTHMEEALAHVAMYAVTASTSFGKAYYQPRFNVEGDEVSERDPETGVLVSAKLRSSSPTYKISYTVTLPHGSSLTGQEEITGTTIGLRGLGMPAPSKFIFKSGDYSVELAGILTSELVPSLLKSSRIRAYGFLNMSDSAGNHGRLSIDRSSKIELTINQKAWKVTAPYLLERARL